MSLFVGVIPILPQYRWIRESFRTKEQRTGYKPAKLTIMLMPYVCHRQQARRR